MGNEIQLGIRITSSADSGAIKQTEADIQRLGQTTGKVASQYSGFAAEERKAAQAARLASEDHLKLDQSLTALLSHIDPAYRATRQLDVGNDLLHRGLKEGLISQDQYQRSLGLLKNQLQETMHVTSGVSRELFVIGREVVSGNFSQLPGSLMVLANRAGLAGAAISALANPLGIAATLLTAGAAAWAFFGDKAEESADKSESASKKVKMSLSDMTKDMLAMQVKYAEIDRADLVRRQQAAQKTAERGGFGWAKAAKEANDLGLEIAALDRQANLLNGGLREVSERGGKDFQKFMENTGYMDKTQQKIHDLSKAAAEYRDAWLAAGDDTQKAAALERFKQAEKNINEKFKNKKSGAHHDSADDLWLDDMQLAAKQAAAEEKVLAEAMKEVEDAIKAQSAAAADHGKLLDASAQLNWDDLDATLKQNEAIDGQIEKLKQQTEEYGLSGKALAALHAQRLQERIDSLESSKALLPESEARDAQVSAIDDQIAKLRELGSAQADYDAKAVKTKDIAKELGLTFTSAAEDAIEHWEGFGNLLQKIGVDIEKMLFRRVVTEPLKKAIDGIDFASLFSANADGGVYTGSGISAYSGQIVDRPTIFPFAKGIGLMGEAGGEAILPLRRGSNGKLGVEASGGGSNVTVNVIEAPGKGGQVQRSTGNNGQEIITVLVQSLKGELRRDIATGGDFSSALESQFGLNRAAGASR